MATLHLWRHLANNGFEFRGRTVRNGSTKSIEETSCAATTTRRTSCTTTTTTSRTNCATTTRRTNFATTVMRTTMTSSQQAYTTSTTADATPKYGINIVDNKFNQKIWLRHCHLHRQDEQEGQQPTSRSTSTRHNKKREK